jgi:hypothetical protein
MSYFYHLRISGTAYKERIFINIKQYKVTIIIAKMVDKIKVTGSGYFNYTVLCQEKWARRTKDKKKFKC